MPTPQTGDILIRRTNGNDAFELHEVVTLKRLAGPFEDFATAVAAARAKKPRAIWQQSVDDRGRPLGDPCRLPDLD